MGQVVTCQQCVSRRCLIATAGQHAIRASEVFRVGEIAGVERTHQMYYSVHGKIALCAAEKLQLPTYAPPELRRS